MFHQPAFKKVALAGLNSFQQTGYQILVKQWIFDDPIHKKGPKRAVEVIEAAEPGSKAWKITIGDFRVIQVLEFSFILMF